MAFRATPELVSTEDFRVPYTLEGTVRAFNQELLDKDLIEEQLATSESFSRLNEAPYKRGVPDEVRGPLPGFRRAWIPTLPPATTRRSRR